MLLPFVVRWLGLGNERQTEHRREHEDELSARWEALHMTQGRIEELSADGVPDEVVANLRSHHDYRTGRLPRTISDGMETARRTAEIRTELIGKEREYVHDLLRQGRITDESRRRIERELDLEEAIIASKTQSGTEQPL